MRYLYAHQVKTLFLVCIGTLVLAQCTLADPFFEVIDERWTVGLYMESSLGDSALTTFIEDDLNEIRNIKVKANDLSIVALVHKSEGLNTVNELSLHIFTFPVSGKPYERIFSGYRALEQIGLPSHDITENWLADSTVFGAYLEYLRRVYTGTLSSPETLSEEARGKLAFILWGHGNGAHGLFPLSGQSTQGSDMLGNAVIARSFATLKKNDDNLEIDSIIVDACAMAHIEFAHELATAFNNEPVADYLASSQEYVNAVGLEYRNFFEYFLNRSSPVTQGVSRLAASAFYAYKTHYGDTRRSFGQESYSIILLDRVRAVTAAFETFRNALFEYVDSATATRVQRSEAFVLSLFHEQMRYFPQIWPFYNKEDPVFPDPHIQEHNISLYSLGKLYMNNIGSHFPAMTGIPIDVTNAAAELADRARAAIAVVWAHPAIAPDENALDHFGISIASLNRGLINPEETSLGSEPQSNKDRFCSYITKALDTDTQALNTDTQRRYTLGSIGINSVAWWTAGKNWVSSNTNNMLQAAGESFLNNTYCTDE